MCKVVGGNKQQDYISKEDASPPTVATKSVLLSCASDAKDDRELAMVKISNAFIQAGMKDDKNKVIICICGMVIDMLIKIAPEVYFQYITHDNKGNK